MPRNDPDGVWIPIAKRLVPLAHRSGFRCKIGPEEGVWKAWIGRRGVGHWFENFLLFSEEGEMARRRADEVDRWVVIVVLGAEIWSEEFATSEGAEACRRHFEGVEGAKIEVIEDVAG